jgi:hypothetical protein
MRMVIDFFFPFLGVDFDIVQLKAHCSHVTNQFLLFKAKISACRISVRMIHWRAGIIKGGLMNHAIQPSDRTTICQMSNAPHPGAYIEPPAPLPCLGSGQSTQGKMNQEKVLKRRNQNAGVVTGKRTCVGYSDG